jgi:hypothetical protein
LIHRPGCSQKRNSQSNGSPQRVGDFNPRMTGWLCPRTDIITTLAVQAYQGEQRLDSAMDSILTDMRRYVRNEKPRVPNPVNPSEDFADKWGHPDYLHLNLEDNFWNWLEQAQADFKIVSGSRDADFIAEQVMAKFGSRLDPGALRSAVSLGTVHVVTSPKTHQIIQAPARPWGIRWAMVPRGVPDLADFLCDYPLMALRPARNRGCVLRGRFKFAATSPSHPPLEDAFDLEIEIPAAFPRTLPRVIETGGRIPRLGDYHVNANRTLCLGSPLRLLLRLSAAPTLCAFATTCLVPYLYAISLKLRHGGDLVFGELAHEAPGLIADYMELFHLKSPAQVGAVLKALGQKKRQANKQPCPCGCGSRLGRCSFNARVLQFRLLASRSWFTTQHQWLVQSIRLARSREQKRDLSRSSFPASPQTARQELAGVWELPQVSSGTNAESTPLARPPQAHIRKKLEPHNPQGTRRQPSSPWMDSG